MRVFLLVVPLLVVVTGCAQYTTDVPETRGPLEGSWVMTEIAVISERGENRYQDPAPSRFARRRTDKCSPTSAIRRP